MKTLILSGGNGTRLWPVSRTLMPKQFIKWMNQPSLFQQTLLRNASISDTLSVISNVSQKFIVAQQVEEIKLDAEYIFESEGKNSAAAIILGALHSDKDEIIVAVPSDHAITDVEAYTQSIQEAVKEAEKGNIIALGIVPNYPATQYGYIQYKGKDVLSFIEKPPLAKAKEFLKQKNFYWNSGIYIFKASTLLHACEIYIPSLLKHLKKLYAGSSSYKNEFNLNTELTHSIESISIDKALMEKLDKNFLVLKMNSAWNDLGSYDELSTLQTTDENGNSSSSKLLQINSKNNAVFCSKRPISLIDIEGLIVVDTPDALMICKKGSSQKVKELVEQVKVYNKELLHTPNEVFRPWGSYTVLEEQPLYKTKKIVVKPGKRLSLQSHFHRNEHWIVVSGIAMVTIDTEEKLLYTNESTFIPAGKKHRLYNPGKIDLVMIEAQVGEYLGEDDIIRYEDDYHRA